MPIALDKGRTFDVVLKTDQAKPKGKQPTFVFRYLTVAEWQRVLDLASADGDPKQMMSMLVNAIGIGLVDWRRMVGLDGEAIKFDPATLPELLTIGEMKELVDELVGNAMPKGDDLGK